MVSIAILAGPERVDPASISSARNASLGPSMPIGAVGLGLIIIGTGPEGVGGTEGIVGWGDGDGPGNELEDGCLGGSTCSKHVLSFRS